MFLFSINKSFEIIKKIFMEIFFSYWLLYRRKLSNSPLLFITKTWFEITIFCFIYLDKRIDSIKLQLLLQFIYIFNKFNRYLNKKNYIYKCKSLNL